MNPAKSYEHLFSPMDKGDDVFGASGIITFLRAPHIEMKLGAMKASGARFAFLGVPFDEGNIGKPGSVEGPRDIRFMSHEYFPYWFEYEVDIQGDFVDVGDVRIPKVDPVTGRGRIYKAVRAILEAGLVPVLCGGDHSITIPAGKALSDHLGTGKKIGYLQLGAHLSMADEWAGERNTSASAMARMTELPNVSASHVAHVGMRNSMNPKDWCDLAKERGIAIHTMNEIVDNGVDKVIAKAADRVWGGTDAQYISIDMNVLDASAAPGVTSPEPGGLEAREMMRVANHLGSRGSIGVIDLTELCPVVDTNGITTKLAACFLLRLVAAMARARGDKVDPSLRRHQLAAE
ncbi:MAG: agmatinase family protein [Dongiaceae bacterium]